MINNQLLDYIKSQLALNVSREVIGNNLKGAGWNDDDIKEAFSSLVQTVQKSPVAPTPAPATPVQNTMGGVQTATPNNANPLNSSFIYPEKKIEHNPDLNIGTDINHGPAPAINPIINPVINPNQVSNPAINPTLGPKFSPTLNPTSPAAGIHLNLNSNSINPASDFAASPLRNPAPSSNMGNMPMIHDNGQFTRINENPIKLKDEEFIASQMQPRKKGKLFMWIIFILIIIIAGGGYAYHTGHLAYLETIFSAIKSHL